MKHTINIIILCLLLSTVLWSQIPNKISYQGLLTTVSGPVNDGSYTLKFDVYNAPSSGTLRHTETFSSVSVQQGTFNVTLGSTTTLPAIFSESLYVEIIATAGPSGLTYPLMFSPRSALTASPYSLAPWSTSSSNIFYNSGNVGIGTTVPSHRLHVSGDDDMVKLQSQTAGSIFDGMVFYNNTGTRLGGIRSHTSVAQDGLENDLELWSESGDVTFSRGNVGIGTESPAYPLDVNGGIRSGSISVAPYNSTIDLHGTGVSGNYWSLQPTAFVANDQFGIVRYEAGSADASKSIILTDGGWVGIGTATPSYKLDVNGIVNATNIYKNGSPLSTSQWTTNGSNIYYNSGNVGIGTTTPSYKLDVNGIVNAANIYKNGSPLSTSQWTTNGSNIYYNSGKVGIGTSTPSSILDIKVSSATDAYQGIGITRHSTMLGTDLTLTMNQGTLGVLNFTYPGFVDLVTMDFNTRRVGIGRTDPISRLHVNGDINTDGIVYSHGTALISDKQFKKDIISLSSALKKVQSMHGVYFNWRSDEYPDRSFSKDRQIGFIAQEVEGIVPELVSKTPDGYKSVDYAKVTPLLVEAIQEQQKEIDELKSLVKSLLANKSNSIEGGTR